MVSTFLNKRHSYLSFSVRSVRISGSRSNFVNLVDVVSDRSHEGRVVEVRSELLVLVHNRGHEFVVVVHPVGPSVVVQLRIAARVDRLVGRRNGGFPEQLDRPLHQPDDVREVEDQVVELAGVGRDVVQAHLKKVSADIRCHSIYRKSIRTIRSLTFLFFI